ncbi:hypothetical protein BDV95DRAFT_589915 [Massariosphaeria phaeospora]|uniref:Uncharacterized protein n=1 Tax=Massariosphaeria phaeospora TaxID=100035 RepID=A0A7C8IE27_9PLEO|nr:hypothetical protein BDV95DRAFT_589915 [Massariosphaeria phaeospora]
MNLDATRAFQDAVTKSRLHCGQSLKRGTLPRSKSSSLPAFLNPNSFKKYSKKPRFPVHPTAADMFVTYSDWESRNIDDVWLDRTIDHMQWVRDKSFDQSKLYKAIKDEDGTSIRLPGSDPSYCHFIPWKTLFDACLDMINGRTRRDAMDWLITMNGALGSPVDHSLSKIKPLESYAAYNCWLAWGIESILDYQDNIYYGYGQKNHDRKSIDPPRTNGNDRGEESLTRVLMGAQNLVAILPNLEKWLDKQYGMDVYAKYDLKQRTLALY